MYRSIETSIWSDPKIKDLPSDGKLLFLYLISLMFWSDSDQTVYPVPSRKRRLSFPRKPLDTALRGFIFRRDCFTCQSCGLTAMTPVVPYDGRESPRLPSGQLLVIDHIVSIRRGGTHHPQNLQTLCQPCNTRKSLIIEGAGYHHKEPANA
jgi:5-methylcytosine-specific restriction enzyme A